jgi:hypothetical protein
LFEIKCLNCGEVVPFKEGVNDESKIKLFGEIDAPWDAFINLKCKCVNEINIEKD